MSRIEIIQRSLRCFWFGFFGLLPLLGIPLAVMSNAEYLRVRRGLGGEWNPARHYCIWGNICASCGLLLDFLIIVFICLGLPH